MRNIVLALLSAVLACIVLAAPVCAQVYTFDVQPQLNTDATGSYHVVFTVTGPTSFGVTINGNNDGNTALNVPTPGFPAKHSADQFTFTFFDLSHTKVPVTGVGGGTAVPWIGIFGGGTYFMASPSPADDILAQGGNLFTGSIALAAPAATVNMSITDDSQQWFLRGASVTPEATSLALLIPGLAPLGWIVLKRRRS